MDSIPETESSTSADSPYSGVPVGSGSASSSPSSPRDLESPSAFTPMCSSSLETVLPLRTAAFRNVSPRVSVISRHPGAAVRNPELPRTSRTSGLDPTVPVRCRDSTSSGTDSTPLKFGIDRILSDEMSPLSRRDNRLQDGVSLGGSSMPCSECMCSLLRCCRLDTASPNFCSSPSTSYLGYYTTLHTPRPLRSYANMLVNEGMHVSPSDRGGSSSVGGNVAGAISKRKRSWSRAVFSNLQRKGLEKRFQLQKYITKPDRRQLAATLGLTDAQVKVWFQNRRMKWRHSKEGKHLGHSDNRKEHGGPDSSSQEPEIDVQTVDS